MLYRRPEKLRDTEKSRDDLVNWPEIFPFRVECEAQILVFTHSLSLGLSEEKRGEERQSLQNHNKNPRATLCQSIKFRRGKTKLPN